MTNKSNISMASDGPPQKRRRTHTRKSPKDSNQPNTLIVPLADTPTVSSSTKATPNPRREKKPKSSTLKKEVDLQRKREDVQPTTDRCSDYLSDKWKPNFQSTFPLAKSLERRRVLVDYIHLVKRINARKDKVELPPKRLSVLPPQTVEELEKEIGKCTMELEKISRKKDENSELKKNLMIKYKLLYKEEDEERKKLQFQEDKRVAELAHSSELEKLLLTMAASQGVMPGELMQSLAAMANSQASQNTSNTAQNSLLQAQQNLLSVAAAASSVPGVDIAQYFNNLSQMAQLGLTPQQQHQSQTPSNPNSGHSSVDIRNQSAQKHQMSSSPAVTTPNRTPQQHQSPANLMNPTNSSTLNMFHAISSTQNPFSLSNQSPSGLLTQQSQGGLVSSQPQNLHNTTVRDQALNTQQHLLHTAQNQQSQSRASPNVQANLIQQQQNPFLAASSQSQGQQSQQSQQSHQSQQNQQSRPQSAFPPASQANQQKQQLDLQNMQNMLSQWNASQNLASLIPGGLNNPQAKTILATLQQEQQRQINAQQQLSNLQAQQKQMDFNQQQSQQQNAVFQALQQNIFAKSQQNMLGQQTQKQLQSQNLLSAGIINSGSRQSPLATTSYANQQQNQMNRKQSNTSQQAQLQNRLQLPAHQNLTGRSATPQFAVPNLPSASQTKAPPRAQSTRPPMNFAVSSVIASTSNAQPSQSMSQQVQQNANLQSMFQMDSSQQQQIQAQQQHEALLNQLNSSLGSSLSADQQQVMLQMLLMAQHQQMSK